jgi:murein DD-endopeptidase MepM/ murein hydrolase activator NlpD
VIGSYHQQGRRRNRITIAVLGGVVILACLVGTGIFVQCTPGTIAALLAPTSTSTPTPTSTPTRTPTFTPLPSPTLTPAPAIIEPQDHYWLNRPFSTGDNNEPTRFYPYGSTAGGRYRIHHGADFPNPFGAPIVASARGRVIAAGADDRAIYGERIGFYGQLVIVQLKQEYHNQKVYVLYGHLSQVHVHFLQEVEEGDIIGEVGMSGVAIGPHLHLEVRVGENAYQNTRNPELWLRPLPARGTIAGRLLDSQGKLIPQHPVTFYHQETPNQRWQDVTTYPSSEVNSDEEWGENFVIGDVPVGDYLVKTHVNGHLYTAEVSVREGATSFVIIEAR